MIQPSFTEFKKLAKRGTLIPVYKEFLSDTETPVTLFAKLASSKKQAFLLESTEVAEKIGRYSFVGVDPYGVAELQNEAMTFNRQRGRSRNTFVLKMKRLFF